MIDYSRILRVVVPIAVAFVGIGAGRVHGQCYRCADDILNDEHKIEEAGEPPPENLWTAEGTHEWDDGNCLASEHGHKPHCGNPESPIVLALVNAPGSVQTAAIRDALADVDGHLVFNEARGTIQLMDCEGQVIGNAPLFDWQVAELGRHGVDG